MKRLVWVPLILVSALVAGGCSVAAQPGPPEPVITPSRSAPVGFTVNEHGLFATTTASGDSTATCTAAVARSAVAVSGEATLAVGIEVKGRPISQGDLATVSLIRTDGTEQTLETLVVTGNASPPASEIVMSGLGYALPSDTALVRVRFHVGDADAPAEAGVWIDIPLAEIPVLEDEIIGFYHPFGTSITF